MVPSHAAAAALLLSLSPSTWLQRHASAVADVASFLAGRAIHEGHPVDRALVETAALLHDLDKALPTDDCSGHWAMGMQEPGGSRSGATTSWPLRWIATRSVASPTSHTILWVRSTTLEQRLVAYADKRAQRRVVTLDDRFARWNRKHPSMAAELLAARERAGLLEAEDLRPGRGDPGRRAPAALGHRSAAYRSQDPMTALAYIWGDDAWSIDRAARDLAHTWAADDGTPLETWRASLEDDTGESDSAGSGKRRSRLLDA